ncbi:MAG: alternative ribosome rescue aminoacyl-tRNA hydrolase ArfB [Patescibacteria group bacterium]|nr:alternative ribosome rescue aminoacyl-tRNA hydrolase ArfB [Patescibacteria group bacterium]
MLSQEEKNRIISETTFEFARSGGHGGQNVNKTSSKAQLRWNVADSRVFDEQQKKAISSFLRNRLNSEGVLVLFCEEERSQSQNKEKVIARFFGLLEQALKPKKKRFSTKPTRASKERRLEEKKKKSLKKERRKIQLF